MTNCKGCVVSGKTCEGYSFERRSEDNNWNVCYCGHTDKVHPETFVKKPVTTVTERIKAADPKGYERDMKTYAKAVSTHTLTPAEARAKLKAAGHQVGKRGRLSPAQLALAATL